MPQTRPNKAIVPINSDAYNLTTHLATMADSLTVPVKVASAAERDALPSPQNGDKVIRTDLAGQPFETYDSASTSWQPHGLVIDYASSTYNDGTWNLTVTKFTRLRVGTFGIVVVDCVISLPGVSIPANTATPTTLAGVVPAGYRLVTGASLPLETSTTANSGVGQGVHVGFKADGSFLIRSAGSSFTLTAGSTMTWHTAWRWDGVL
jgi:hypothetical protein